MSLVSVIMPSCNSEAYIQSAIQSVLEQSYRCIELVVVDDGSNDSTVKLINAMAEKDLRLKLIELNTCSGGPATPRNAGLKAAKGDYLAFIDSDDLWHPEKIELQLRTMQDQGYNFLSSLHIPFKLKAPQAININISSRTTSQLDHSQLLRKNSVITSSAIMIRSLFNTVQFDQDPHYIGVEDYLAWLQIHQSPTIKSAILNSPLVFYRLRENSLSSSKATMAKKIFHLLSHYQIQGKPLGFRKYYYFATYAFSALKTRLVMQ